MFAKGISDITLTNEVADRLFDNIVISGSHIDKTFLATLRAVLYKRLPVNESVAVTFIPLHEFAFTLDLVETRIKANGHGYSIIVVYPLNAVNGKQLIDTIQNTKGIGEKYLSNYAPQEDLRLFYSKMLTGLFYTGGSGTVIFLDSMDLRKFHALQMMIPRYLPHLFSDTPLSAEENALLKSLGWRSPDEYIRLIEHFARHLDMRREMIISRLKDFEIAFEREQMEETISAISKYQKEYEKLLMEIRVKSRLIQDSQIMLAGLDCYVNSDDRESVLMDYFLCNKNLSVIRVRGVRIEFVVHGYADVYDEEAFKIYVGNHCSYFYRDLPNGVTEEEMELLYRAVFERGVYKLRMCAAYRADMSATITPLMNYAFPPESRGYLPNPHIQNYGCIGGYSSRFMEYMHNKDYVGAIDQAVVSAQNLNFHDLAVIHRFVYTLSRTSIKCIEGVDGECFTPKEAIRKLRKENLCQNQSE